MKNSGAKKRGLPLNKKGESMVTVTALVLVFFFLGASIMMAASSTTGTASARFSERQTYYYARSALDVVDDALRKGELGKLLCENAREQLESPGYSDKRLTDVALPINLSFTDPELSAKCRISDGKIAYSGYVNVLLMENGQPAEVSVRLQTVELTFTVKNGEQTYSMDAVYRCNAWGTLENGVWRWNSEWKVQQVG